MQAEDLDRKKERLIHMMDESRQQIMAAAERAGGDLVVYQDTGWRVKDLLAHVLVWAQEAVLSIQAALEGGEYALPQPHSDDEYNARRCREYWDHPVEQTRVELAANRDRLIAVLQATPADRFEETMLLPWGERNTLRHLLDEIAKHEHEHAAEIRQAAQS